MKELFADHIVKAVRTFDWLKEEGATTVEEQIVLLNILRYDFESIGLESAIAQIDRIKTSLRSVKNPDPLALQLKELEARYLDELKAVYCFIIPRDSANYWTSKEPFGAAVMARFASAATDIEEAGKCLACRRSTAAVFHLMRVMEVGLRAMAATLNDQRLDPKRNPSWDSILRKCSEELAKERRTRAPEWANDDTFFSGATASLMAVKDAWRNPTMHVEINYDQKRAIDIWNQVGAFMRHLATRLQDRPTGPLADPAPPKASEQAPPSSPESSGS